MKYLKMLGLAAVAAMALMAFLGASSASATVLCTTNSNPCGTGWHYTETVHITTRKGTTSTLKDTSGSISDTCHSTTHTKKVTTGSSTTTPVAEFEASELTWSECTNTTITTAGGSLEIHATGGGNGTVTAKGAKVTIVIGGVSCTYGAGTGINLGNYTGSTGIMVVNTVVTKVEGSFLCPSTSTWTGEYELITPEHLYAEES